MSLINLNGSVTPVRNTVSIPDTIRGRKVSSTIHYQTKAEFSTSSQDALIADRDWLELVKLAWDTAPNKAAMEKDLDTIRQEMLAPFLAKKDKAGAQACKGLYNQYIVQTCWGFPGYCREAEENAWEDGKEARRKASKTY